MAQTKREKYESEREAVKDLAASGQIAEEDAAEMLRWCDGYDPENAITTPTNADDDSNRWGETRAPTTLRQWLVSVSAFARDLDESILDADADDLNRVAQRLYEGKAASTTKPQSKNTVRTRQNCLKRFLRHLDNGVDPADIAVFEQQSTIVDPEDMLTRAEFHALRQAPEHPRDKAIVDICLYTGQRNTAIRTLRIKDLDLDGGKYRLNSDVDGLKGADLVGTWNPLLAATGAVRDWLTHHPDPDNPDAYLLCERRDSIVRDASETISNDTINRVLREAATVAADDEPEIAQKPTHAHALRHNFVTMCKRDYDMDDDVIKRLIRHKPESDVMATTYAHLSDSDYIEKAEEAFGYRDDDEDESPMTPQNCGSCREPLPPNAKACPSCGAVFTPDAANSKRMYQQQAEERVISADTEVKAEIVQEILKDMRENPDEYPI